MMTQHDKELVKRADRMSCDQIDDADLESLCETEEGREEVHRIRSRKWHLEEFACGME